MGGIYRIKDCALFIDPVSSALRSPSMSLESAVHTLVIQGWSSRRLDVQYLPVLLLVVMAKMRQLASPARYSPFLVLMTASMLPGFTFSLRVLRIRCGMPPGSVHLYSIPTSRCALHSYSY
ncbi:hypothetical protein C8R44DRAFT_874345 [Mycena epipterygia]|nr:hypothetical protein C8R44DRAFT_874345 [Mycena epipterygia]